MHHLLQIVAEWTRQPPTTLSWFFSEDKRRLYNVHHTGLKVTYQQQTNEPIVDHALIYHHTMQDTLPATCSQTTIDPCGNLQVQHTVAMQPACLTISVPMPHWSLKHLLVLASHGPLIDL